MAIDYEIHYDCEPKRALTLEGLMGRLKGRDRAAAIIKLYRDSGDQRAPKDMGFEMVRRTPDGEEEVEIVIVQNLLDAAEELIPYQPYCVGCPANRIGVPFGCVGTINYPISYEAERWMIAQLPDNEHPLPYMLLQRALIDMNYTGEHAATLRKDPGVFFESDTPPDREFGGVTITGDQIFEMLFLSGPIYPAHGSLLLQFFGAISPDLEADVIMQLAAPPSQAWLDENVPFQHTHQSADDGSITAFKEFLYAVYLAFRLGVPVLLDI
ncbi:MAG TPA: hypothetical protein PKD09_15625 [Aggregatilinea sp.]|jgi:hypothetical protein|uniref:hypothetical protein n=1 Tax=Aggregatilinea sp. TaxID=2806333 RepID=UPI002B6CE42F|nr:hypothetical protein [Aggregatilinea sp.]HML23083.1 hypothetical protein [Aggregatilinea sp.]